MSDRDGRGRPAYGVAIAPRPTPTNDVPLALVVHVLGGVLAVVGLSRNLVVLAALLPALILLLASRKGHPWRREEARQALNFQITVVAVTLLLQGVSVLVAASLVHAGQGVLALGFFAGFVLLESVLAFLDLIASVIAAVRTRRGGGFRYPVKLDLVK